MTLKNANKISGILKTISHPARLAILLAIGEGEACVCHLEAMLGKRQAYISQHLMALRQADILRDRREGRFIFYSIANPALLALVRDAELLAGVTIPIAPPAAVECACPHCTEETGADLPAPQVKVITSTLHSEGNHI
ncbi:MAG: metalloregulator ArsR/SmtB family transcription factor [Chloroflexota bacterium]